jgi:hypothetical protein
MEDYDWLLDLVNIFCNLYVPYKFIKNLIDADKEIATIIRCQKSIHYIRKTKTEGYINYDFKLEEKFKDLETDLKFKLKEARKERKQFSMGTISSASYQFSNTGSDSSQPNNVELDSKHLKNVEFDLDQPNNVEFDLNQSMDNGFEFFGYDF